MKKLLISILAVLTLAGSAKAETVFTINNIGGWYIVGVTAYKVGDHRPNEAFEKFAVNLGQKRVFSSKDWQRVDVRIEIAGSPGDNHVYLKDADKKRIYLDTYGPSWAPEFYWKEIPN